VYKGTELYSSNRDGHPGQKQRPHEDSDGHDGSQLPEKGEWTQIHRVSQRGKATRLVRLARLGVRPAFSPIARRQVGSCRAHIKALYGFNGEVLVRYNDRHSHEVSADDSARPRSITDFPVFVLRADL
jgi:hypothetical protein